MDAGTEREMGVGLAVSGDRFVAFFAVANDGDKSNRTDIVSVTV